MDDNIKLFKDFTGCDHDDEALHLLEACQNDLQRAIDQYFAIQNRSRRDRPPAVSRGPSSSRTHNIPIQSRNRDTMEIDDEDIVISDDEPTSNGLAVHDGVRAPIAPVQGPIVRETFQQTYQSRERRAPINPVFEQFHDFRELEAQQYHNIANRTQHASSGPSNSRDSNKASSLAALFRPPVDLMFAGEWEAALAHARFRNAWLIVNIQKPDEFSSQVLNRDVWSNSAVKEIVKSNFVLWQIYSDSPSGIRITGYYNIRNFPAVFIVDPRIGEAVQHIQTFDPLAFLDQLTTFLERYPNFEARDRSFVTKVSLTPSTSHSEVSNGSSKSYRANRKRASSQDEAIEGLLEDQTKRIKLQNHIGDRKDEMDALCNDGTKLTTVDKDEWKKFIGPDHSQEIKIVLRMPDSRREKLTLYASSPLKALLVYIDGQGFCSREHLLVLSFPKRIYSIEDKDKTLKQLNFGLQEVVDVEKK